MRAIGSGKVLLTRAEFQCYELTRRMQRKQLQQDLISFGGAPLIKRLSWAKGGIRLILQYTVFFLLLPLILLWWVLSFLLKLVRFPFLWLATFRIPKGLVAPGEKNLVGIHNAFGRYVSLSMVNYVELVEGWVTYLYGDELSAKYPFGKMLEAMLENVGNLSPSTTIDDSVVRRYLAQARERLSKELGHYASKKR